MTYQSTESQQLWKHHKSGQVILLDAIAPLDETDENSEYRYFSQGSDMGSDTGLILQGWNKIAESEYVGMPKSGLAQRIVQVNQNKAYNDRTRDEDLKRFPGNPEHNN